MQEDLRTIGSLITARAWLYELFHKLLGGEPTDELLDALACSTTLDALDEYVEDGGDIARFAELCGSAGAERSAQALDDCKREYNRLLVGLGKPGVALWESVHTPGDATLFGKSTLQVREAYGRYGLAVARPGSVPEDGLALMLGFLAELARRDFADLSAGEVGALTERLEAESDFLAWHVCSWLDVALDALPAEDGALYPVALRAICAFAKADSSFARNAAAWFHEAGDAAFEGLAASDEMAAFEGVMAALEGLCALRLPFLEEAELVRA